jgi:uncharacterized membrane protein YccC
MTSTATLPITIVAKACEAAIESIEDTRRRFERDRQDGRSDLTRARIEFIGRERHARCAALLALCNVTRKAHCTTVTVSAEDAAAINEFIA